MDRDRRDFLRLGALVTSGLLAGCGKNREGHAPHPIGDPDSRLPSLPPPVPAEHFVRRREEVTVKLREEGFDFLLVTPGSNLIYLTGASFWRSERLLLLVMKSDGSCQWLGPAFEMDRIRSGGVPGEVRAWEETEDPIARLAEVLSEKGKRPRVALEGTTWFDTFAPLSDLLPGASMASATPVLSAVRMRKDAAELDLIRAAVSITLDAIRQVMAEAREGMTERELLERAQEFVSSRGGTLFGLAQFGPNSSVPHATSGARRLLASDVMLFDFVTEVRGYHADITRTFAHGSPPPRFKEVHRLVQSAQAEAIRAVRPGISAEMVDRAARNTIVRGGFGKNFTHRLGHGFGLDAHEPPYLVEGNRQLLEPGMTVTVEPGIYLPGEFGVRLEDDVLVTAEGCEVLSAAEATAEA